MQRTCDACGRSYEAKRSTSRYCSSGCRTKVARAGGQKAKIVGLPSAKSEQKTSEDDHERLDFCGTVEKELRDAGRLDTTLGRQALFLAETMRHPLNTGASVASLSKEFRAVMAAAMEGANATEDPVSQLQREWKERLEQRRRSS